MIKVVVPIWTSSNVMKNWIGSMDLPIWNSSYIMITFVGSTGGPIWPSSYMEINMIGNASVQILRVHTICMTMANLFWLSEELQWEATKTLYREMLLVFEKIILPTYASCHVQFLIFYFCSIKPVGTFLSSISSVCQPKGVWFNKTRIYVPKLNSWWGFKYHIPIRVGLSPTGVTALWSLSKTYFS